MTWIIVVIVAIVLTGYWGQNLGKKISKTEDEFNEALRSKGIDQSTKTSLGTYVGGHPQLDYTVSNVFSFKHNNVLELYAKRYKKPGDIATMYFDHIADIPIKSIKNIVIENTSSIEQKVTLGRVLLVGVFALAWKKKKINEEAFLNIQWSDGKYDHETLFQFGKNGAYQQANMIRNVLIRQTSS